MAADFATSVVAIGGLEGFHLVNRGVVEIALDIVVRAGLVVLRGEPVVGASIEDGGGDLGPAAHGGDGDQRALQIEALKQQRDGGDFVRLRVGGLLAKDATLA
jgi:hypothetical protein